MDIIKKYYQEKEKKLEEMRKKFLKKSFEAKKIFNKYRVKAYLFGSVAKGVIRENSDIDFYIEGLNNAEKFFSLKNELESFFNRNIDIITEQEASSYLIKRIKEQGIIINER